MIRQPFMVGGRSQPWAADVRYQASPRLRCSCGERRYWLINGLCYHCYQKRG